MKQLPSFPFGAVYFRKSNPPAADWKRDYETAAADHQNMFRHWFLWSAIEVSPGEFDWSDYDAQLDLAAQNGMKTIIAEMITLAPEWAFRVHADARLEDREGRRPESRMHGSCVVGGAPGLCLDHPAAKEAAGRFLTELVTRYKDHPGLGGYDVWNETNYPEQYCYCPATAAKFREWLQDRYGDLPTLRRTWHRYSLAEWSDVHPPRAGGPYPDTLDWLQFRMDNAYSLLRWRTELVRSLDDVHPVVAHGVAQSVRQLAPNGCNEWRAAAEVDVYGFTWNAARQGDSPWRHWHAVDLVRSGARGKPFWHAEAVSGPLWMQPQVPGRPRNDGRIARPEDIRLWRMQSFAGGATGLLPSRWRPLLDGPLFGAFGPYGMDGSRTPRSRMLASIAEWVQQPRQRELWRSRPVKGDLGIIIVPESQQHCYAQQGNTQLYGDCTQGAYQGFFSTNLQADWVHIEDIGGYETLYLPYPVMLTADTAAQLIAWVERGGQLISEGCPGYFGDHGHVGQVQPNNGLDELFGARQSTVEFTPDLLDEMVISVGGAHARGAVFRQAYELAGGRAVGWYENGEIGAVDHGYGRGRARLIGTFPGAGFMRSRHLRSQGPFTDLVEASGSRFFADLAGWAGISQHVRLNQPRMIGRLHDGAGGTYLWLVNPLEEQGDVEATLSKSWGPFNRAETLWGAQDLVSVEDRVVRATIPARDVAVIALS